MPKFENYEGTPFDEEDHQKIDNGKDYSKIPLSTEMEKQPEHDQNHFKNFLISYLFASLATLIKTIGTVSFYIT